MTIQSIAMQQALNHLRDVRESLHGVATAPNAHGAAIGSSSSAEGGQSFLDTMKSALDSVNQQQTQAKDLQNAYIRGEDVSLTDVVLSMQKSSVAFEATVQIRNKVLESYREIMSMSV